MLIEIFKAIMYAGFPIAIISYYLIIFTSQKTHLVATNASQYKKEIKTIESDDDETGFFEKLLRKKLIKFGGGFYGIMTLITYIHVEVYQFIDFIKNFESFSAFIDKIGFSMILNFFIEAIMNLITALLWPLYWFKYMPIGSFLVWIIVAIVSHTLATRYALSKKS